VPATGRSGTEGLRDIGTGPSDVRGHDGATSPDGSLEGGGVRRWRGAVRDARSGVVVHQTRSPVLIDVEQTLEMPPQNLEQLTRVYGPTT